MKKLLILLVLFPLLFLISCGVDWDSLGAPNWETGFDFALVKTNVLVSNVVPADFIQSNDNQLAFDYETDIEFDVPQDQVDDLLSGLAPVSFTQDFEFGLDPVEVSFQEEVGELEIEDITNNPPVFYLTNLVPAGALGTNGGSFAISATAFPSVTNSISNTNFSSATFASGSFDLTLTNNLSLALSSLLVEVGASGEAPVLTHTFPSITVGEGASHTFDLSGVTLPGDMQFVISGTIGDGSEVTIDFDSELISLAYAYDLMASDATAIINETNTINLTNIVSVEKTDSNVITSATISNGVLDISLDNQIDLAGSIAFEVPQLTNASGLSFITNFALPASSAYSDSFDLAGYTLTMGENPGQTNQVISNLITAVFPGSEGAEVSVSSSDIVDIDVIFGDGLGGGLSFSSVSGNFFATSRETNVISLTNDSVEINTVYFTNGEINIAITNGPGLLNDISFRLNELSSNGVVFEDTISLDGSASQSFSFSLAEYLLDLDVDQNLTFEAAFELDGSPQTLSPGEGVGIDVSFTNLSIYEVDGNITDLDFDIPLTTNEFDGIPDFLTDFQFGQVDITIDADPGDILNPVPVDATVNISGSNSDGDGQTITIATNDLFNNNLFIDNGADLINIFPDTLYIDGDASINGTGTFRSGPISAIMTIHAPLSFSLNADVETNLAPVAFEGVEIEVVEMRKASISADINSDLDIKVDVRVLLAETSNALVNDDPDVLEVANVTLEANGKSTSTIELGTEDFNLIANGGFYQLRLVLRSTASEAAFLSDDAVNVFLYGGVDLLVLGEEL